MNKWMAIILLIFIGHVAAEEEVEIQILKVVEGNPERLYAVQAEDGKIGFWPGRPRQATEDDMRIIRENFSLLLQALVRDRHESSIDKTDQVGFSILMEWKKKSSKYLVRYPVKDLDIVPAKVLRYLKNSQ